MTDWGIPDWRDPSAYGDTSDWSEPRWHWEFVRRREDCRIDFISYAEQNYLEDLKLSENILKAQNGSLVDESPLGVSLHMLAQRLKVIGQPYIVKHPSEPGFTAYVPDCREKYQLWRLPNPAISEQLSSVLQIARPFAYRLPEDVFATTLPPEELAIVFNITIPIQEQLEQARLQKHEELFGHPVLSRKRKHQAKWLTYLRVLDARESGASWSSIAKSGVLGTMSRRDPQAARQAWLAARALSFRWPD
jgi:hypothetical protein